MCLLHPQKAEEEVLAQEQSRQRALDAERERVAEMQRRQQEQEQFSAFEEMIRRQELEKERQRLLLEFATPATPSPDTPLIPGIGGPSIVSPAALQSPGGLPAGTNHQLNRPAANIGPPIFDRSLKPGSVLSPGNNSELIFFLIQVGRPAGDLNAAPHLLQSIYSSELISFPPPDLLHFLSTPCLVAKRHEILTFAFKFCLLLYMVLADTMVDALRQLAVPAELCQSFLRLAEANTSRAVETCGILCGKLVRRRNRVAPLSSH